MKCDILVDPLPHVSFSDAVANPLPPERVTYYLNGPMSFWRIWDETWAQFHQRSTYSFYEWRSRKHKKILILNCIFLRFQDLQA